MTGSSSIRSWVARIRPVVVAAMATVMVASAACSSTVPTDGPATSGAKTGAPLAVGDQLDAAIRQAMAAESMPGDTVLLGLVVEKQTPRCR